VRRSVQIKIVYPQNHYSFTHELDIGTPYTYAEFQGDHKVEFCAYVLSLPRGAGMVRGTRQSDEISAPSSAQHRT
jgi:hypothetical protein